MAVDARIDLFALVPVKDPLRGKSRLGEVLGQAARSALNLELARRTFDCCAAAFGASRIVAVTASASIADEALSRGIALVPEAVPGDLNAALVQAAQHAQAVGAQALLVVPTDLVLLTAESLRQVANALLAAPGCLIVPDRRRTGTNLLGLNPSRADLFRFGEGSFDRHRSAAIAAGLVVRLHEEESLALDVDLPEDYSLWRNICTL